MSSRIEETKTDVSQILRSEAGQVPSGEAADDATEVTNYIVAMEHGLARVREGFPISIRLFREMQIALSDQERFLHETDLPLLAQLAVAHYQFEVIHPFLDGNGRIGRLMIPLMLVLRGALPQPLLYLSAFFEQHRSEYYDHLLFTSQRGDMMP